MSTSVSALCRRAGSRYSGPRHCLTAFLLLTLAVAGRSCGIVGQSTRTGCVQQYMTLDTIELIDIRVAEPLGIVVRALPEGVMLYVPGAEVDPKRLSIRLKPWRSSVWRAMSITLPDSIEIDAKNPLADCLMVGDSTIVLLAWRRLLRYDFRAGSWTCTASRRTEHGYHRLWHYGHMCVLGRDMYVDPISEPHPFAVAIVNTDALRIEREILLPAPSGLAFTLFQPRRVLDVSRQFIVLSDANRYRIRIYDQGDHLDTILERMPDMWTPIDGGDSLDVAGKPLKLVIDEFGPKTGTGSLMRSVAFINDSVLLVSYTNSGKIARGVLQGKQDVRFDIWKRSEGRWSPIAVELGNYSPQLQSVVSRDSGFPISARYRCENGYIVSAEALPVSAYGRNWEEIIADANAYVADNSLRMSIVLQRWVVP